MGGFQGLGGSSANTDRATQLSAQQGNWNIFGYGLPQGEQQQQTGQQTLNSALTTSAPAEKYFTDLLTAGRTQTAQNSAPAVNQELANAKATRDSEGTFGTSRAGGTAAANREASSATGTNIDNIINANLNTGKATGASGLEGAAGLKAGIGGTELSNALSLLGLSQTSINSIMKNATDSRKTSYDINKDTASQYATVADGLLQAIGF